MPNGYDGLYDGDKDKIAEVVKVALEARNFKTDDGRDWVIIVDNYSIRVENLVSEQLRTMDPSSSHVMALDMPLENAIHVWAQGKHFMLNRVI